MKRGFSQEKLAKRAKVHRTYVGIIEFFFKWIKQHLKIKVFWGRSENAMKTQICIALCTYLIVAMLKKRLNMKRLG